MSDAARHLNDAARHVSAVEDMQRAEADTMAALVEYLRALSAATAALPPPVMPAAAGHSVGAAAAAPAAYAAQVANGGRAQPVAEAQQYATPARVEVAAAAPALSTCELVGSAYARAVHGGSTTSLVAAVAAARPTCEELAEALFNLFLQTQGLENAGAAGNAFIASLLSRTGTPCRLLGALLHRLQQTLTAPPPSPCRYETALLHARAAARGFAVCCGLAAAAGGQRFCGGLAYDAACALASAAKGVFDVSPEAQRAALAEPETLWRIGAAASCLVGVAAGDGVPAAALWPLTAGAVLSELHDGAAVLQAGGAGGPWVARAVAEAAAHLPSTRDVRVADAILAAPRVALGRLVNPHTAAKSERQVEDAYRVVGLFGLRQGGGGCLDLVRDQRVQAAYEAGAPAGEAVVVFLMLHAACDAAADADVRLHVLKSLRKVLQREGGGGGAAAAAGGEAVGALAVAGAVLASQRALQEGGQQATLSRCLGDTITAALKALPASQGPSWLSQAALAAA